MSLTSMDIANASLLDEATAAAEGMVMSYVSSGYRKRKFLVDVGVLPQTLAVLRTRAKGFNIDLVVADALSAIEDDMLRKDLCGVLVQYPDVNGHIKDFSTFAESVHAAGALVVCATDLLALTMIKPPGEWGADIVLGNSGGYSLCSRIIVVLFFLVNAILINLFSVSKLKEDSAYLLATVVRTVHSLL